MTEDELIDIMKTAFLATHPFPDVSVALRAALAVARPIIEREALEKAKTRYDKLLGAFSELQVAAQKAVDETDSIHDKEPWPLKYRAPYEAITELRQLLATQYGAR